MNYRNYEFNFFFVQLYYLNINISVTICAIDLKFPVSGPKVLPEGRVSQIFVLGLSFDCM